MKYVARRAKPADLESILDLAEESVARDPLPVKVDRAAMRDTARTLFNPAHFMWVTECDGSVIAAVAACVQRSFWYRGFQCSVLLFFSRGRGAGLPLLREFARWVKSRSGIKVAIIELEPNVDPRIVNALCRMGFSRKSLNLCYVRVA